MGNSSRNALGRIAILAVLATLVAVPAYAAAGVKVGDTTTTHKVIPILDSHFGDAACAGIGSDAQYTLFISNPTAGTYTHTSGATFGIERPDTFHLDFSVNIGFLVSEVVVKGGDSSDLYDYNTAHGVHGSEPAGHTGPVLSDTGLSPPKKNNQFQNLSQTTFCFDEARFSISGTKFHDHDLDGTQDTGDDGVGAFEVVAYSNGERAGDAISAIDGSYEIANLIPGDYVVCEVLPAPTLGGEGQGDSGWQQTAPDDNVACDGIEDSSLAVGETLASGGHSVTLVNADVTGKDFGNNEASFLECGEQVFFGEGEAIASFKRLSQGGETTCAAKPHATETTGSLEVIFVPSNEGGTAGTYEGTIQFIKDLANPIPKLRYDQDALDNVDNFEDVPVCETDENPVPSGHTWCVNDVDVTTNAETQKSTIVWGLTGIGDPKFG